jgi:hypothetical protein
MTNTQYEILQAFDTAFRYAIVDNTVKAMQAKDTATIELIYREITGDAQYKTKLYCGTCVLKLYKKIGQLYLDYKPTEELGDDVNISIDRQIYNLNDEATINPSVHPEVNISNMIIPNITLKNN